MSGTSDAHPEGDGREGLLVGLGARRAGSRRGQVLELLREAIMRGDLQPGEHLKQDELAARFGLSPSPVREAMRELESEGLVKLIPHRGVVVCDITSAELLGVLIPVRLAIETYALPLAAERMSPAQWDQLEVIVSRMGAEARQGRVEAVNDLDVAFHERCLAASDSDHAQQLWRVVLPRIRLQFQRLAPLHARLRDVELEHRRLLDAMKTEDARVIAAALREHLVVSAEQLLAAHRE